jgi:hypothetical protein
VHPSERIWKKRSMIRYRLRGNAARLQTTSYRHRRREPRGQVAKLGNRELFDFFVELLFSKDP